MTAPPPLNLVMLTGPVGGGKSTTARLVAAHWRAAGHRVGVIDLDLLADMVRPHRHYGEPDLWQMARSLCGALAEAMYAQGHDTVIVEGEFFCPEELAALEEQVGSAHGLRVVTLDVSYGGCLSRVAADPSTQRVASRDPEFLRRMHEDFLRALTWLREIGSVYDVTGLSAEAVATRIAQELAPALYGEGGRVFV